MKNIGTQMVDRGYDVEFMHCSSDNNSLDGIVIKDIKVALLDGTAPHVVDPKNPGAVDEILHLGDYWNENGIRENKEKILELNANVGKLFARAYKYIAAAKSIYDDIVVINKEAVNAAGVNLEADKIITDEFGDIPVSDRVGNIRKLFGSAITPNGFYNYLESVVGINDNIYVIKGAHGTGTGALLSKVADAAIQRGFDVEAYYCPMEPDTKVEHVVIPALSLAFTTSNKYHEMAEDVGTVVDLDGYVNNNILSKYEDTLAYDVETFDMLLTKAIDTIKEAKQAHDLMETYYIPNMRFDDVQICWEKTMERILKYAEEFE
ncbi:ATPase [Petroclostridium sp. X23]|uniref:ATPase n=1 Tax=Petroclostridium sp. X23 TaxID=3045146 RepID=UPI0024AC94AC|nr:ATPase [Petroclostridium sp. X23]WHH59200.1 ATPase [Petroclostridium sp. X23]